MMTFTKKKQMSLKLRTKYSLESQFFYLKRWIRVNGPDILAGFALGLALIILGAI